MSAKHSAQGLAHHQGPHQCWQLLGSDAFPTLHVEAFHDPEVVSRLSGLKMAKSQG